MSASYEEFFGELQERMNHVNGMRNRVYDRLAQYYELRNALEVLQKISPQAGSSSPQTSSGSSSSAGPATVTKMIDVGAQFFVEAEVNPTTVYVDIGLGFRCAMSIAEALSFIEKREVASNAIADKLSNELTAIRANMRILLDAMNSAAEGQS